MCAIANANMEVLKLTHYIVKAITNLLTQASASTDPGLDPLTKTVAVAVTLMQGAAATNRRVGGGEHRVENEM